MKILEALYKGLLYPAEQIAPDTPEYHATVNEIGGIMRGLESELDETTFNKLENLRELEADAEDMTRMEMFEYGLCMGMKLMQEFSEMMGTHKAGTEENNGVGMRLNFTVSPQ